MAELARTVLKDIVATRWRRIEEARARLPLGQLEEVAEARSERRDFAGALSDGSLRVVAELKRASPSRGLFCRDYQPRRIAEAYAAAGARALSVLTEEDFFLGSLADLQEARAVVSLPVLRKDFVLDGYQVFESVAMGADALLLIVAALPDRDLRNLLELCARQRIAALVEAHTAEEVDRALAAGARIVGINNRDLNSMQVSLETSLRLRAKIPPTCLAISESGIKKAADLERLAAAGFNAVLIGERLMAAPDPGRELAALLEGAERLTRGTVK